MRSPLAALGALLVVYLLAPVVVFLIHLESGAHSGLATAGLGSALWISASTATVSMAIITLLGVPLGWALAHGRGWVWELVGIIVQLPLALPPLMSGILLIDVVGPYTWVGRLFGGRLTDTAAGIVLAQTFVAAPFLVIAARSAFAAIDPALLDVAATLGHGGLSRFFRVSLPLAAPGVRAGMLLSWLRAFGEFGATVILAYHPYSLPVFTFVQFSSTGVPSTLAPTGAALGTAAAMLVAVRLLSVRRRAPIPAALRGIVPGGDAGREHADGRDGALAISLDDLGPEPLWRTAATVSFDLRARVGAFELELQHAGHTPYLAVLGASGAGKSLTLRCLAGLQGSDVGRVTLGDRRLDELAAEHRRIGWVPQDAALLPHLDVWRQLTFAVDADPALAATWLHRLDLDGLAHRLPHQLSGGQRQRVAFARALATRPDLILLDEPFSAIDRPVRDALRRQMRRLQRTVGVPTVLVTHDAEEAALLADEIIVLADGRVLQSGLRPDVFARPASPKVAELLAVDNLRSGHVVSATTLRSHGTDLHAQLGAIEPGAAVSWCVRAEHVRVRPEMDSRPADPDAPCTGATVIDSLDLGAWQEVTVRLDGGLELTARTTLRDGLLQGSRCEVLIEPEAITAWRANGHSIAHGEPVTSGSSAFPQDAI
ncbi:MAG TPA: ATP-binding cassette domain-containing protein [Solirubrobacteraceae bacterium]|nr:ATP-binding cassette domain-containing protein [Solirubrobacteraceae bacterium]